MKQLLKQLFYDFFPKSYKNWYYKKVKNTSLDNLIFENIEPELSLLKVFLKDKDSIFLDVGANNGLYIFVSEQIIAQNQIFAFEPNPLLTKKIKHLFSKVNIFELGLSNKSGFFSFKIPHINNKEFATRGTLNIDYKEDNETNSTILNIKTQCLDEISAIQDLKRIDLIKIDVEGFELFMIEGAKKTIQKYKPILFIEIEERHHQKNLDECINEIKPQNYSVFYLDRNTKKLELYDKNKDYQSKKVLDDKLNYINNFIFIPNN